MRFCKYEKRVVINRRTIYLSTKNMNVNKTTHGTRSFMTPGGMWIAGACVLLVCIVSKWFIEAIRGKPFNTTSIEEVIETSESKSAVLIPTSWNALSDIPRLLKAKKHMDQDSGTSIIVSYGCKNAEGCEPTNWLHMAASHVLWKDMEKVGTIGWVSCTRYEVNATAFWSGRAGADELFVVTQGGERFEIGRVDNCFPWVRIHHLPTDQWADHDWLDEFWRNFLPIIPGHANAIVDWWVVVNSAWAPEVVPEILGSIYLGIPAEDHARYVIQSRQSRAYLGDPRTQKTSILWILQSDSFSHQPGIEASKIPSQDDAARWIDNLMRLLKDSTIDS